MNYNRAHFRRTFALVLVAALASGGCYNTRQIPPSELKDGLEQPARPRSAYELKIAEEGKPKRLHLKTFHVQDGVVIGVGPDGTEVSVPLANVTSAKENALSPGKSVAAGVGVLAVIGGIVTAFLLLPLVLAGDVSSD